MTHTAHRTTTGWTYRGVRINPGSPLWTSIVDGETYGAASMRDMKALIDRLLDGPATL